MGHCFLFVSSSYTNLKPGIPRYPLSHVAIAATAPQQTKVKDEVSKKTDSVMTDSRYHSTGHNLASSGN